MSDNAFQSQQFAAQQSARGSSYELAGSESIRDGLPQAPMNYLKARRMAMEETAARAEIANAELRNQDYQLKVQATAQLQQLGMAKHQAESMRLANESARLALEEKRKASRGEINMRDLTKLAIGRADPIGTWFGDKELVFEGEKALLRQGTPERLKARDEYLAKGRSHADPAKLALEEEALELRSILGDKEYGELTPEARRRLGDWTRRRRGQEAQASDPTIPRREQEESQGFFGQVQDRVQMMTTLSQMPAAAQILGGSLPESLSRPLARELSSFTQKVIKEQGVDAGDVSAWLTNAKEPQNLARVLIKGGLSEQQAAVHLRDVLGIPIDKALKAVEAVR